MPRASKYVVVLSDCPWKLNVSDTHFVDFNLILETLQRGIRRTDIFLGLGMNASEMQPPISHVLERVSPFGIQLVREDLSDDEKLHVALEFGKWITNNGLRELVETFSISLHQVYGALHAINIVQDFPPGLNPSRFERMGVGDQVAVLQKIIPILDERVAITRSLNQARNCYAHRNGRVGNADIDENSGRFELSWLAISPSIQEPDGTVIPESEIFGRLLPAGGVIRISVEIRSRAFRLGDELNLSKAELKAICLCVHIIGGGILEEAQKYAIAMGIPITSGNVVPPEEQGQNSPAC